MIIPCPECAGSGKVEFTRERGGPICNNCGGAGYLRRDRLRLAIAAILDHPGVYMGGPSAQSMRRADRIVEMLDHDWKVFGGAA